MRIEYTYVRHWLALVTPYFFICTLPQWLGITQVNDKFATFRFYFDNIIAGLFFSGIAYLVYAVVHNASLERSE